MRCPRRPAGLHPFRVLRVTGPLVQCCLFKCLAQGSESTVPTPMLPGKAMAVTPSRHSDPPAHLLCIETDFLYFFAMHLTCTDFYFLFSSLINRFPILASRKLGRRQMHAYFLFQTVHQGCKYFFPCRFFIIGYTGYSPCVSLRRNTPDNPWFSWNRQESLRALVP